MAELNSERTPCCRELLLWLLYCGLLACLPGRPSLPPYSINPIHTGLSLSLLGHQCCLRLLFSFSPYHYNITIIAPLTVYLTIALLLTDNDVDQVNLCGGGRRMGLRAPTTRRLRRRCLIGEATRQTVVEVERNVTKIPRRFSHLPPCP